MSGVILPGMPGEGPEGAFVMPMMRGFPCDVGSPMVNGAKTNRPTQGLGVGASNVPGQGVTFFVSIHGDADDTLVAQLDYVRYRRLCELLAGLGKTMTLIGFEPTPGEGDAFGACESAHVAIAAALLAFGEKRLLTKEEAQALADAFNYCAVAIGADDKSANSG